MALVLLGNNGNPFGQFDGYDALSSTMLGGEVATLVSYDSAVATDKHAKDIDDGYVVQGPSTNLNVRPIVTTVVGSASRPLFLTDDGTANYGTLFGTLVGGNSGQTVSGGTVLGPSTMSGSGKVTLWANPGLYGITMDAVNTAGDGLVTTNNALTVGTAIRYLTANGKLTPTGSSGASTTTVGTLVEFSTGDTLVTTPRSLTRVGIAGGMLQFKYVIINFNPPVA